MDKSSKPNKPRVSVDKAPDLITVGLTGTVEVLDDVRNIAGYLIGDEVSIKLEAVISKRTWSENNDGERILTVGCKVLEVTGQEEATLTSGSAGDADIEFDD